MIKIRIAVLVFLMLAVISLKAEDSINTQKRADIISFLSASGSGEMLMNVAEQIVKVFKDNYPDVPEKVWEDCKDAINTSELIELLVPIYDRNFTHVEIKEMIKFYHTPVGKKLVKSTPQIIEESYRIGEQWGKDKSQTILDRLKKDGYIQDK